MYLKKKILIIIFVLFFQNLQAQNAFNRGVNLTSWFQVTNVKQIQFTKYTKQDFIDIKALGADVIRLPINLHYMTDGAPEYNIEPLFLNFLNEVVNWATELEMNLIFDNHTFDPATNTDANIGDVLIPVWKQMARHYKNSSKYIYYEILNEPHGITDALWNSIQMEVIDSIRTIDTMHTIIIGPAGWNSFHNLSAMPIYTDDNLIYTFHFYDPFLFTHQGASWTDPSMVPLANMPFPYDPNNMPEFPNELVGTWIQSTFNNYKNDGTLTNLHKMIDIADVFQKQRNVKLFCGEFGVYIPNSNNEQRVNWYYEVRKYMESKNITWTIWDYQGGFGLYETGSNELYNYDLNIPLVNALGFIEPPQSEFVMKPDSSVINLYNDYIGANTFESSSSNNGVLDYYSETNPARGDYCIYWAGVDIYNQIGWNFRPNKDLSYLVDQEYFLNLWIRGNNVDTEIDLRFVDTKIDEDDHPWRNRYILNNSNVNWNGEWNHLQIPFSNFTEHGSWDNEWFSPQGDFDWAAIDKFEIVSEHHSLSGIEIWFDEISIVDSLSVGIDDPLSSIIKYELKQNFPNPFNPTTTINYSIPEKGIVKLKIYDVLGKNVETIVSKEQIAGNYDVYFDASKLTSGVYFYQLQFQDKVKKKLILLK
jgi:endoglucanase